MAKNHFSIFSLSCPI